LGKNHIITVWKNIQMGLEFEGDGGHHEPVVEEAGSWLHT